MQGLLNSMSISVHWRWGGGGGGGGERGRPPREKKIMAPNEEVVEDPEFGNFITVCLKIGLTIKFKI